MKATCGGVPARAEPAPPRGQERQSGRNPVVLLLEMGLNREKRDKKGRTPLLKPARFCSVENIQVLVKTAPVVLVDAIACEGRTQPSTTSMSSLLLYRLPLLHRRRRLPPVERRPRLGAESGEGHERDSVLRARERRRHQHDQQSRRDVPGARQPLNITFGPLSSYPRKLVHDMVPPASCIYYHLFFICY